MAPMNLGLGLGLSRRIGGGTSGPPPLVLDTLTAGAAYSTRKLRTAYAGAALRVRRSSDNVEQDIGFSGTALDTTALTSFIGSNSGFVTTWYDQSGNGRHLSQTDTTRQPRIVNAGTIETAGGVPAPWFDGTNDLMWNSSPFLFNAGQMTACIVCNNASANGLFILHESDSASANSCYRFQIGLGATPESLVATIRNNANVSQLSVAVLTSAAFNSVLKNIAIRDTGSLLQAYLNGANGTDQPYTRSGTYTINRFAFPGRIDGSGSYPVSTGHVAEGIFFATALSNANMNTVNANQGAAFGITVNPI